MVAFGLLLVAPGVLILAWYALVAAVIEIENRTLRASFSRSRELVRGHFGPVLLVVVLFSALSEGLAEGIEAHSFLGEWVVAGLSDLVTIPVYGVAIVTLALELMARKPTLAPEAAPD